MKNTPAPTPSEIFANALGNDFSAQEMAKALFHLSTSAVAHNGEEVQRNTFNILWCAHKAAIAEAKQEVREQMLEAHNN